MLSHTPGSCNLARHSKITCACILLKTVKLQRSALQELADAVKGMLHAVGHFLLTAQASLPLPECLPFLSQMADAWAAYACTEEKQDDPSLASPDSGENAPPERCPNLEHPRPPLWIPCVPLPSPTLPHPAPPH